MLMPCERERDLALRWAEGAWAGSRLRAESGEEYTLIFQGRRGGGAGPDFRDAVLARADGTRICGDVELHLRSSGWRSHGHTDDARYNSVVLHVVRVHPRGSAPSTRLASGALAPVVALRSRDGAGCGIGWPCGSLTSRLGRLSLHTLLTSAGIARFEAHAETLRRELCLWRPHAPAGDRWDAPSRLLFVSLAEGLGYGRDRKTLRAAGERLVGVVDDGVNTDPLTLAHGVERMRLRGLLDWHSRWRATGPWPMVLDAFNRATPIEAADALRKSLEVPGGCVSPGRAGILAANVALPFAAAIARLDGDADLERRALAVYLALPGLPSNAITREMTRQLSLARQPPGAARQQGLHHLWATHCREKRCESCPCNVSGLAPSPRISSA